MFQLHKVYRILWREDGSLKGPWTVFCILRSTLYAIIAHTLAETESTDAESWALSAVHVLPKGEPPHGPLAMLILVRANHTREPDQLLHGVEDQHLPKTIEILAGTAERVHGDEHAYQLLRRIATSERWNNLPPEHLANVLITTAFFGVQRHKDALDILHRGLEHQAVFDAHTLQLACKAIARIPDKTTEQLHLGIELGLSAIAHEDSTPRNTQDARVQTAYLYLWRTIDDKASAAPLLEASEHWVEAAELYLALGQLDDAFRCLEREGRSCALTVLTRSGYLRQINEPADALAHLDAHPDLVFARRSYAPKWALDANMMSDQGFDPDPLTARLAYERHLVCLALGQPQAAMAALDDAIAAARKRELVGADNSLAFYETEKQKLCDTTNLPVNREPPSDAEAG